VPHDDLLRHNRLFRRYLCEVCPHGSWGTNVASWLVTRKDDPRFLLIRYEDLVERPHTELSKMAEFLGLNPDRDRIAQAIDRSSAHNMRKLEQIQHHLSTLTKDGRTDIPFVRAAASGGWKKELPIAEVAKIEQAWSPPPNRSQFSHIATTTASAGILNWSAFAAWR
jgi:hypothetical protein